MEYVIVDIETTGLDVERSAVIEAGAILVEGNRVKDKFSSLVQHIGILPEKIRRMTGISEEMLYTAPPLPAVVAQLQKFIKNRPVVSHNGFAFDFRILEREGLRLPEQYDSLEFAFFILPTNAKGHSIEVLAERFSLGKVMHRALDDCLQELAVINALQKEFSKKPKPNREALVGIAQQIGWWWVGLLPKNDAYVSRVTSLVASYEPYRKVSNQDAFALPTSPIDLKEVEQCFVPRAGNDAGYAEDRPPQRRMAALVAQSFNEQRHAVIEAGTGTGKSKAYLVPSLLFALKNNIPVIISTHTKALQDQLSAQELPHLERVLQRDIRTAVLKGKRNYVCLQKFEKFAEEIAASLAQRSLYEFGESRTKFTTRLAFLLLTSWITETDRGDWDELPYWFKERIPKRVERDVCNIEELCTRGMCESYDAQKCFLTKARLRARDADIIIVNHAVMLMGILTADDHKGGETLDGGAGRSSPRHHTIFPNEARYIVFDEAHHLEDAATSAWEFIVSQDSMEFLIGQLFDPGGADDLIKNIARRSPRDQKLQDLSRRFEESKNDLTGASRSLFTSVLPKVIPNSGVSYTITKAFPNFSGEERRVVLDLIEAMHGHLKSARGMLDTVKDLPDTPVLRKILVARTRLVDRTIRALDALLSEDPAIVRYVGRNDSFIELKAAPLSVAALLKQHVYDYYTSVVLTSATVTVEGKFDFFATRSETRLVPPEKIQYQMFTSSFDYEQQVKFFVPKGISYKGDVETHFERSAVFLEQAVLASNGGALILCSSHEQVARLYNRLVVPLADHGIWLLKQERGASVSSMIRDFKTDIDSVLIGTETLWQGIDVPGPSLRSLFIYKIPYRVPDLPLIEARCNEIESRGGGSYAEYYRPFAK